MGLVSQPLVRVPTTSANVLKRLVRLDIWEAWRSVPELLWEARLPQIGRLTHMRIGGDALLGRNSFRIRVEDGCESW